MSDDAKASSQAKWIHSIGNLVLLHPRDNRDQSDALPWSTEKLENFEKSELYLNRLTTEDGWKNFNQAETETLESVSLDAMPTLDVWDGAAVESRAKLIWSLIESDMRDSFK
jgi:hypothetical protein